MFQYLNNMIIQIEITILCLALVSSGYTPFVSQGEVIALQRSGIWDLFHSIRELVPLLLVGTAILSSFSRPIKLRLLRLIAPILIFHLILFLKLSFSTSNDLAHSEALKQVWGILILISFSIIVSDLVDRVGAIYLTRILYFVAVAIGLLSAYELYYAGWSAGSHLGRYYYFFGNPQFAGSVLALGVVIVVANLLTHSHPITIVLSTLVAVALFVMTYLTGSRSALALALLPVLCALVLLKRMRVLMVFIIATICFFLFFHIPVPYDLYERGNTRADVFDRLINGFVTNPLFGADPSQSGFLVFESSLLMFPYALGIVGFFLLMWYMFNALGIIRKSYDNRLLSMRTQKGIEAIFGKVMVLMIVSSILYAAVEGYLLAFLSPTLYLFLIFLALGKKLTSIRWDHQRKFSF